MKRWAIFFLSTAAFAITATVSAQQGEQPSATPAIPKAEPSFDPFTGAARLSPRLQGDPTSQHFLHPDVAFILSAEVADRNTVRVRWTIAEGYYLYRDKFKFSVKDEKAGKIGPVSFPPGKMKDDEFFGRIEVFYNNVEGAISLERTAKGPAELVLDVGYQGCAEAGLCYPPITKTLPLSLPALLP